MKRTEVAMIVLIASLSMMLTFTLVQSLLGDTVKQKVSVEKAIAISEDIASPAKRIFNEHAINPTVEVCVEVSGEDESNPGEACRESQAIEEVEQN